MHEKAHLHKMVEEVLRSVQSKSYYMDGFELEVTMLVKKHLKNLVVVNSYVVIQQNKVNQVIIIVVQI